MTENASSKRRLQFQLLEERIALSVSWPPAVGVFERLDGLPNDQDLWASASTDAWVHFPGYPENHDSDSADTKDDSIAYAGPDPSSVSDDGESASAAAHALSEVVTGIGQTTVMPTLAMAAAEITSASQTIEEEDWTWKASATASAHTALEVDFQYQDPDEPGVRTEKGFLGEIYLVGVGSGIAEAAGQHADWSHNSGYST